MKLSAPCFKIFILIGGLSSAVFSMDNTTLPSTSPKKGLKKSRKKILKGSQVQRPLLKKPLDRPLIVNQKPSDSWEKYILIQGYWWSENVDLGKTIQIGSTILSYTSAYYWLGLGAGYEMRVNAVSLGADAQVLLGLSKLSVSVSAIQPGSASFTFGVGATPYAYYNLGGPYNWGIGLGAPLVLRYGPTFNSTTSVIENGFGFSYAPRISGRLELGKFRPSIHLGYVNMSHLYLGLQSDLQF